MNQVPPRPADHDARVRRYVTVAAALVIGAILINGLTHLFPQIRPVTGFITRPNERSAIELAEALLWIFAAVVFVRTALRYRHNRTGTRVKFLIVLAFGVLGVLVFGEETSWGQHFGLFEPPESVASINGQQEFNLHNLNLTKLLGLSPEHPLHATLGNIGNLVSPIFQLFCVTAWGVLPLLARASSRSAAIERVYPLPARVISLFIIASYAAYLVINFLLFDVAEVMELATASTAALVATDLFARAGEPDAAAATGGGPAERGAVRRARGASATGHR